MECKHAIVSLAVQQTPPQESLSAGARQVFIQTNDEGMCVLGDLLLHYRSFLNKINPMFGDPYDVVLMNNLVADMIEEVAEIIKALFKALYICKMLLKCKKKM
ncbi:hypothetical protein XENOCAPTIV_023135 [Xenoophorus captivus]|uniref:Uncharacterized protein n=1 Tax=Xenoophorus captivus TaxID=1517983 RepID=A0ABV0SH43_9TELE